MHALRTIDAEPIPGYRLLEPLGKGGFGEVWKCQAPGGFLKAIKFVGGNDDLDQAGSNAEQELRALENLKSIRHPFLLSIERVEIIAGDLIIITELADRSLHDLVQEYRSSGNPGIPRAEVITYLREAAEVLDFLNQEHGLQHLDIKPRNLFLIGRHIKVADFGLVASLADLYTCGELLGGVTPLYAAPEIFEGKATLYSDQYSLAVTYHELITGHTVFEGRNFNHLVMLASSAVPNLSRVGEPDQVILKQALNRDPRARFPSCTAFIEALAAVSDPEAVLPARPRTTTFDINLAGTETTTPPKNAIRRRDSKILRAVSPQEPAEAVLPGYQLLECLSRGETGELWRASGPRGDARLVRFFNPPSVNGASPLDRLLALNHECLAELEVVPLAGDRVAIISEAGDLSLAQRFKECRTSGQPGIPRQELLNFLGHLTQALDELYAEHELQHLLLSPRHFAVSRGSPILLEFGLAEMLWLPAQMQVAAMNPRYAAGELFEGLVSDACDQYSLALIYQELLVGLHPFRNLNARQMASPRLRGAPDVSWLPASDRPIVLQALSPEPEKRFRSCREFIHALEEINCTPEPAPVVAPTSPPATRSLIVRPPTETPGEAAVATWRLALDELVTAASQGHEIRSAGLAHYRLTPGQCLEHRGWAKLPPGMAKLKLAGFREQWQAEILEQTPTSWLFDIRPPANLWQRCMGRSPGVVVEVVLGTPREKNGQQMPVRITLQPVDCAQGRATRLLQETGMGLLTSLLGYLNTISDRAGQERFPVHQLSLVEVPGAGASATGPVRDLGRTGLTVIVDRPMPTGAAQVTLTRWASPLTFQASGWVRECRATGKQYEVEVELPG